MHSGNRVESPEPKEAQAMMNPFIRRGNYITAVAPAQGVPLISSKKVNILVSDPEKTGFVVATRDESKIRFTA